ncbi:MAG: serine/threonine protein kinase [Gemmatales bacterium]|nr:MAG: serine/threonine protein kinase [Gemmatales bacterium]
MNRIRQCRLMVLLFACLLVGSIGCSKQPTPTPAEKKTDHKTEVAKNGKTSSVGKDNQSAKDGSKEPPQKTPEKGPISDWTYWRGPLANGTSPETNLPASFSPRTGENVVWKQPYGARCTPIVMNGRVYLINRAGEGVEEQERVMCLDAYTGKVLWEHRFNVFFTDIVSVRLGWTQIAADPETDNVYAHGTQGLLFCFDKEGKVLWHRSLTEEYGRITGYGGRVTSPIVDSGLVIIGMLNSSWGEQARGGNRYIAFNKLTGEPVWWTTTGLQPRNTYNSVPVVTVLNGERVFITGGAAGDVSCFRVRTGEKVWSYQFGVGAINVSPIVEGTKIYICHGEESPNTNEQGRVICLDAGKLEDGKPTVVWKHDGIPFKYCTPILHQGRLYVADDTANLHCFDAATGKILWQRPFNYGRTARGSPVYGDGKIYVADVNGYFNILEPGPDRCKRLHRQLFRSKNPTVAIELSGDASIAYGHVYFTTSEEMYCIGKTKEKFTADFQPPKLEEPAPAKDAKPGHLQVVPADVVLAPGGSANFTARLFDDHGRFLREVKAKWTLTGMGIPAGVKAKGTPPPLKGEIDENGKLTVAKDVPGQFGRVVAEAEGLKATARVRVAPQIPITEDFEKVPVGQVPAGWVNTQGKFVVVEENGNHILKKTANVLSPLVIRARAYIGTPDMTGYTIQADVKGTRVGNTGADAGIFANRYMLFLNGTQQQLRLVSWDAQSRVNKTISYQWDADTWYTLKMTVKVEGDHALVQGKVWKKGEKEPEEWTVEFKDPKPNTEGAPGLYGYIPQTATGSAAFYDNVKVTKN